MTGLPLQAELQAEGEQSASEGGAAAATAAVRPAADARDFADEAELIEDAEAAAAAAAAAAAEQQRQLGVVTVALQAGGAAEEEDYDFDGEPAAPSVVAAAPAMLSGWPGPQLPNAPVSVPVVASLLPGMPAAGPTAAALPQVVAAQQQHVRLPVIGRSLDGETVLRFSELYGYQGVMAGHVASVEDLRPPPLLPRAQHRRTAQRSQPPPQPSEVQAEGDEEALMLAADLELPAGADQPKGRQRVAEDAFRSDAPAFEQRGMFGSV